MVHHLRKEGPAPAKTDSALKVVIPVGIMLAAFAVRVFRLGFFDLNHDEMNNTLFALVNSDTFLGIPVSYFQGYVRPVYVYLVSFFRLFSHSPVVTVRLPAVLIGTATVFLLYVLADRMYTRRAAVVCGFVSCFLPWHITQSRVGVESILTPFLGCALLLVFACAARKKSVLFFTAFSFLLSFGSFYTYEASMLLVPVFLTTLLCSRKEFLWLDAKAILLSLLVFLLPLIPIVCLYRSGSIPQYFLNAEKIFSVRAANLFSSGWDTFFHGAVVVQNNAWPVLKTLFLRPSPEILDYAPALSAPLLVHWLVFFILSASVYGALRRRSVTDITLLAWLGCGLFGTLLIRHPQARHLAFLIPPCSIFVGTFFADAYAYASRSGRLRSTMKVSLSFVAAGLVLLEALQLTRYYQRSPASLAEARSNGFGCREAAEYLAKIPDIETRNLAASQLMTVTGYFLISKYGDIAYDQQRASPVFVPMCYYVTWAPEFFRGYRGFDKPLSGYLHLKQRYPDAHLNKTIYFGEVPAVYIFKVTEDQIRREDARREGGPEAPRGF